MGFGFAVKNFDTKWQEQQFQKIIVNNEVVGGMWVDEHTKDNQLREIQIDPKHQRKGIGTLVVKDVVEKARKDNKKLWLKVLHENQAITLYNRLGFTVTERTETQTSWNSSPNVKVSRYEYIPDL